MGSIEMKLNIFTSNIALAKLGTIFSGFKNANKIRQSHNNLKLLCRNHH